MNLYGVFYTDVTPKWGLLTNKRNALRAAKLHKGYVGVIRNAYDYGSPRAWDAPTFRVTMDLVADFRSTK